MGRQHTQASHRAGRSSQRFWLTMLLLGSLIFLVPTLVTAAGNPKLFSMAKDAFSREKYPEAAMLCWRYLAKSKAGDDKYESAQFYLAQSLEKLGFYNAGVEYYYQVANTRQSPELLPRALKALETISLTRPFDEDLILRDLVGDTDFGEMSEDLSDFVYYWQGMTNLERELELWASERFAKISRRGYYFFSALYVASIRLLAPGEEAAKRPAVESFATLFGPLELGAALEALRRRGESDSKLAYSLKALINDDNAINVRYEKLPQGWEIELTMLGLARISAETEALLQRAKDTDEEALGLPVSYQVQIGGIPIFTRALSFEERGPAIKAVASRYQAIRKIRGKALHSLSRLLFEQKQYAAAYNTLGTIPAKTELSSEILLERAWSKYKAGDPHRAMGLLYALDAPVYRWLFAPEKYVLRGLIYRRFCHFRAAKLAARQFRHTYGAALRLVRAGLPLVKIRRIRDAALRRPQTLNLHLFARSLKQELAALAEYSDEWKASGLEKNLVHLYQKKRAQIGASLAESLEQSARDVAEEMLETEEQVNLLEYEVGQAIFQRLSESSSSQLTQKRAAKIPFSSDRTYYLFGGEYWTDELPHYKFNIEDRCVD